MLASLLTNGAAGQRCEYDRRHRSNVEKDVPFHCDFSLDVSTSAREGAHGMVESQQWDEGAPMRRHTLPNKSRGVRRVNDRRVLNGIFWVLRSGAPWRDLPVCYGPRKATDRSNARSHLWLDYGREDVLLLGEGLSCRCGHETMGRSCARRRAYLIFATFAVLVAYQPAEGQESSQFPTLERQQPGVAEGIPNDVLPPSDAPAAKAWRCTTGMATSPAVWCGHCRSRCGPRR